MDQSAQAVFGILITCIQSAVLYPAAFFHLLFLGFLPDVDAATVFASTAAVSRSAADTVLMSKLISCEQ